MKSYDKFTARYVADLKPVGAVETELANACADLQFRLHRLAAAEHNLFAIGLDENGEAWETGHSESHSALTFAETIRNSKDPLATLTTYEQRLSRRLLQTLNKLHQMQADRRALEERQLAELYVIASQNPAKADTLHPQEFGFVCSNEDWKLYQKRRMLLNLPRPGGNRPGMGKVSRLTKAA